MAIPEILAGLTGMNMYAEDARVATTPGHSQYLWSQNFQHFFDLKDSVKDPCDSAMPCEDLQSRHVGLPSATADAHYPSKPCCVQNRTTEKPSSQTVL